MTNVRKADLPAKQCLVCRRPFVWRHWSQCQMQSGTTGINTLRIYNPTKQAQDHDPDGVFVRRWIPELAAGAGSYPEPIVEHTAAVKQARARLAEFRRRVEVRAGIEQVAKKHGSRKGKPGRPRLRKVVERPMPLFDDALA